MATVTGVDAVLAEQGDGGIGDVLAGLRLRARPAALPAVNCSSTPRR